MSKPAHEIASDAINATVSVVSVRDFTDGSSRYTVNYVSTASRWLCRHRFHSLEEARTGALVLADWLGARFAE
jgi:hypothetical protein